MSSEGTSTDDQSTLQGDLEDVYESYRHQHLQKRLDEIAVKMEETLLQITIARRLFDSKLTVEEDTQEKISKARSLLDDGNIEALADMIDDLDQSVSQENTRVENEIHELRIQKYETAKAMRRINEQIQVMDQGQLRGLEYLFDNWEWKVQVGYDEKETFEARQEAAREFAEDMAGVFAEAKESIGGAFDDSTVQHLVNALLNEERITLSDLDQDEVQDLTESELGNFVEISLG